MILGYHFHLPARLDQQGRLWTDGAQGRFVESLASRCDEVVCFFPAPSGRTPDRTNYPVAAGNVRLVSLGKSVQLRERILRPGRCVSAAHAERGRLDALLLRGPTPLLVPLANALADARLIMMQTADPFAAVRHLPRSRAFRLGLGAWTRWEWRTQCRLARRALVVVNSTELRERWRDHAPRLLEIPTSTLQAADFFRRDDSCHGETVRILHVGQISDGKGVGLLADAVLRLLDRGHDLRLELVGGTLPGSTLRRDVESRYAAAGFGDRVRFHGFLRLGPELFEHHRRADVFVSASLLEGFPRSIWEALANSLPVIATRVGSVPHYLRNEQDALLIDAGRVEPIETALLRVVADGDLRRRLIANGRALAERNTLEVRTGELLAAIDRWLPGG